MVWASSCIDSEGVTQSILEDRRLPYFANWLPPWSYKNHGNEVFLERAPPVNGLNAMYAFEYQVFTSIAKHELCAELYQNRMPSLFTVYKVYKVDVFL